MLVVCGRLRIRTLGVPQSTAIHDVTQAVEPNRPTNIRFDYRSLLRATRSADADREVRTLLANLEPAEILSPDARAASRDRVADYNPLGQFGGAAARHGV